MVRRATAAGCRNLADGELTAQWVGRSRCPGVQRVNRTTIHRGGDTNHIAAVCGMRWIPRCCRGAPSECVDPRPPHHCGRVARPRPDCSGSTGHLPTILAWVTGAEYRAARAINSGRLSVDRCQLWQRMSRSSTQTVRPRGFGCFPDRQQVRCGGEMNCRIGTGVINSVQLSSNGQIRSAVCRDNWTYPEKAMRRKYCRANRATAASSISARGVASRMSAAPQLGPLVLDSPGVRLSPHRRPDLRKAAARGRGRPSAVTRAVPVCFCARIMKASKFGVHASTQWRSSFVQLSFAQLRPCPGTCAGASYAKKFIDGNEGVGAGVVD
jgi:hypothetical protein